MKGSERRWLGLWFSYVVSRTPWVWTPRDTLFQTQYCCTDNCLHNVYRYIQSTLIISNSKGPSELRRDIHTSIYQICRIEEKIIRTTTSNKYICNWTLEVRDTLYVEKYCEKEEKLLLFHNIFLPVVRYSCLGRDQIFTSRQAVIRDKRVSDNESHLYNKWARAQHFLQDYVCSQWKLR